MNLSAIFPSRVFTDPCPARETSPWCAAPRPPATVSQAGPLTWVRWDEAHLWFNPHCLRHCKHVSDWALFKAAASFQTLSEMRQKKGCKWLAPSAPDAVLSFQSASARSHPASPLLTKPQLGFTWDMVGKQRGRVQLQFPGATAHGISAEPSGGASVSSSWLLLPSLPPRGS